jgi:hypothetical protein
MEHIVKSLSTAPELNEYLEEGFEDAEDAESAQDESEEESVHAPSQSSKTVQREGAFRASSRASPRATPFRSVSRASTVDGKHLEGEDVSPDMEDRLLNNPDSRKRLSQLSMADVADRHLRDKTDAIAYIIRNISEQCAAAVEGLELARSAEHDDDVVSNNGSSSKAPAGTTHGRQASMISQPASSQGSEFGDDQSSVYLNPERNSSVPPTPDLVHRSGTSMSMTSASTTPERHSLQHYPKEDHPEVPTRVVEGDEDVDEVHLEETSKFAGDMRRNNGTRVTVLRRA